MKKKLTDQNFLKKFEQGKVQIEIISGKITKNFILGKIISIADDHLSIKIELKEGLKEDRTKWMKKLKEGNNFYEVVFLKTPSVSVDKDEEIIVLDSYIEGIKMIIFPKIT